MRATRIFFALLSCAALAMVIGCDDDDGCPTGQTECDGACIDTSLSSTNCGVCGNVCGSEERCCGGMCVDTDTDENNCGSCGNSCGAETCVNGTCGGGSEEICNNVDDDGDGQTDEGLTRTCDNPCGAGVETCEAGIWGACSAPEPTDEVCDGEDNDCDGQVDEDVTTTYYHDSDEDGFGDADDSAKACEAPAGYIEDNTDCDDEEAAVNPDATEECDGTDNNCDGGIDEGCTCELGQIQECGEGGDEGECEWGVQECIEGEGGDSEWDECIRNEDQGPHPEICDGLDNDCDGETDEGLDGDDYEANDSCDMARGPLITIEDDEEPLLITGNLYTGDGEQDADWYLIRYEEGDGIDCIPFTNQCNFNGIATFTPPEGADHTEWSFCLYSHDTEDDCSTDLLNTYCTDEDHWDDELGAYAIVLYWDGTCSFDDSRTYFASITNAGDTDVNVCSEYELELVMTYVDEECED